MVAPVIPALNDHELERVLEAAAEAGAQTAGWVLLRLPYQNKPLFLEWLAREYPDRASRIEHMIRETRSGQLSDPRFGKRMRGEGETARIIKKLFDLHAQRVGLRKDLPPLTSTHFRRPTRPGDQLPLFR